MKAPGRRRKGKGVVVVGPPSGTLSSIFDRRPEPPVYTETFLSIYLIGIHAFPLPVAWCGAFLGSFEVMFQGWFGCRHLTRRLCWRSRAEYGVCVCNRHTKKKHNCPNGTRSFHSLRIVRNERKAFLVRCPYTVCVWLCQMLEFYF